MLKQVLIAVAGLLALADANCCSTCCCPPPEGGVLQSAMLPNMPIAMVAHTVHSMTVLDLQQFEPTANEINFVPVINMNLTDPTAILPHATNRKGSGQFSSYAMKKLDDVLEHMDEPLWDIANFNTVERITHAFHMQEMWSRARGRYDEVKKNAPSAAVCACMLDVEKNGMMKALRYMAMAIREPQLVYDLKPHESKSYRISGGYKYRFARADMLSANRDETLLKLLKPTDTNAPLRTAADWKAWKASGDVMHPDGDYNTALFLYCALSHK